MSCVSVKSPTVSGPPRNQCGPSVATVSELPVESGVTGEDAPPVPLGLSTPRPFSDPVGTHTESLPIMVQDTPDLVFGHTASLSTVKG